MNFLSSQFNFGATFLFASFLSLGALILWWIIRKRIQRVWLPTVRILNLPKRSLPKMTRIVPPLIPFLCFLLGSLVILLFSLQPQKSVQIEINKNQQNYHIFVDLSPSHSAHAHLDEIRTIIKGLYNEYRKLVAFSLSDSRSSQTYSPLSDKELDIYLNGLEFHREGVKLGEAFQTRLEAIQEVDRIYIISDRDFHSWSDFRWEYLKEKSEVYRIEVNNSSKPQNIFINNAQNITDLASDKYEWEIEITRSASGTNSSGTLIIQNNEKILFKEKWNFPPSDHQIRIRAGWFGDVKLNKKEDLLFTIVPDEEDAIQFDNTFWSQSITSSSSALIIADQSGELQLEDPAHHLTRTLEVLGFQIDRLDHLPKDLDARNLDIRKYDLILIAGGTGLDIDDYCPYSKFRESLLTQQAPPKIWLFPISQNADYSEMCHCLNLLRDKDAHKNITPAYCQEANTRANWSYLLKSLGGKAVGGEIDSQGDSIAWIFSRPEDKEEILTFTISLNPRQTIGPNFARFPILMKALLSWQELTTESGHIKTNWPRIEDITTTYNQEVKNSNVPYGESTLRELPPQQLPDVWQNVSAQELRSSMMSRQSYTPVPWIRGFVLIILVIVLFECAYSLFATLKKRRRRIIENLLFFLIIIPAFNNTAEAQIALHTLGYLDKSMSSHLAFEVSARTSIELGSRVTSNTQLDKTALSYPWLWVRGLSLITNNTGEFDIELVNWIKKGGFLIIEDVNDQNRLDKAIQNHFSHHAFQPEWKPIPPDHEIMRSFYLLDSLPSCQPSASWQGFLFDNRLAILVIPFRFLETLVDNPATLSCSGHLSREQSVRTFVNILMVALATDYKRDQIHLPEILKRLR